MIRRDGCCEGEVGVQVAEYRLTDLHYYLVESITSASQSVSLISELCKLKTFCYCDVLIV